MKRDMLSRWHAILALTAAAFLMTGSQCALGTGPAAIGIRITATTWIYAGGKRVSEAPTEGVFDKGIMLEDVGPGGGNQSSFNGLTDFRGVDDHPYAITNAYWDLQADYTFIGLGCVFTLPEQFVPDPVFTFNTICQDNIY